MQPTLFECGPEPSRRCPTCDAAISRDRAQCDECGGAPVPCLLCDEPVLVRPGACHACTRKYALKRPPKSSEKAPPPAVDPTRLDRIAELAERAAQRRPMYDARRAG